METTITAPLTFQLLRNALAIHGDPGTDRNAAVEHITQNIRNTFQQDVHAEQLPRVTILRCDHWTEREWRGLLTLMGVAAA